MGFSGGGSNVLKSHTHDGTIVQDGGSLNMDNVTQAALTAGDMVYSDGVHLQRLGIGGSGQALTSSGAAPQWSAGSTAIFEKIASGVYSSGNNITLSFSAVAQTDVSFFRAIFNGTVGGATNTTHFQINGLTSNYNQYGNEVISGTQTLVNATGGTTWYIEGNSGGEMFAVMDLVCNTNTDKIQMCMKGAGDLGFTSYTGINTTAAQTSLSSVKVLDNNPGATLGAGSTLSVYRVNL